MNPRRSIRVVSYSITAFCVVTSGSLMLALTASRNPGQTERSAVPGVERPPVFSSDGAVQAQLCQWFAPPLQGSQKRGAGTRGVAPGWSCGTPSVCQTLVRWRDWWCGLRHHGESMEMKIAWSRRSLARLRVLFSERYEGERRRGRERARARARGGILPRLPCLPRNLHLFGDLAYGCSDFRLRSSPKI